MSENEHEIVEELEAGAEAEATVEPRELTDEERAKLAELDEQLEKLMGQKRWSDVIRTILAKAEIVQDPTEKVALFREAGMNYIDRSSNQAEAIKCFEKVLEVEPHDIDALTRLKEMYEKRRDWESLIRTMEREAELLDPADRPIRYVEMAELATARIRKPDVCIGLWEKVLEAEPTNPAALEALAPLYERARSWEPLATVLEQLTEADPDPKMLQKLGMIYADKIGNDEGAVRAFRRLLEVSPGDRRAQEQLKRRYVALKAWDDLEEFYAESQKWDELIRLIERGADDAEATQEEKIELLFRAARLWVEKKDKADRAARAYEKVLDTDEDNLAAAEALSAIYEAAGDARKLAPVYEVRLRHDMEPMEKVALLRELGLLYEEKLRKADVAFEKYLAAFAVMPSQEVVREDVLRLAEATKGWDKAIEAFGSAIGEAESEDDEIELRLAFATVLKGVEKTDDAIAQYQAVYALQGDHQVAIAELQGLYLQTEKWAELLQIFERRMELEDDADRRRVLAYQRAGLFEGELNDAAKAIDAYGEILAEWGDAETDAYRSLDRLFETEGRWQELADTLHRRIELGPESIEELAALKFRLGRALHLHLEDKPQAVDLYREVLTLLPEHDGARIALEELLVDEEVAPAAARILEPVYEDQSSWEPLIRALRVLHQSFADPDERLALISKIGAVYATHLGDIDQAFAAFAEGLSESPGSEDTLAQLENIAIAEERFPQLVELISRIAAGVDDPELARRLWVKNAEISDTQLGDIDGAVAAYRKVLDIDPGDLEVLLALDAVFRRTERWADLVAVLRRRVEQSTDPVEQEELLAQMAAIHDEFLEDTDTAISVHREILELDPTSQRALAALDDLFGRREMWVELADNVDRQLELCTDDAAQIVLMLRLAELRETRMNAPEQAIEIYREVLDREPTQEQALAQLERLLKDEAHQLLIAEILEPLYRDGAQVPKLIGVHEIQAKHASAPERRVELLHRIAELYEVNLEDYPSAFDSYSRALAEEPGNMATQEQLERLSPMLGDMEALAKTYEDRVEGVEDPVLAAHLHVKAAQIRETQLGDAEGAIAHYQAVLGLDDSHIEAATALERLYQLGERYEELAQIFLAKTQMLHSPDEQKEYLYRAAALYEEILERPADAIGVYHQALEIDPEDLQSLDKLIELNLRLGQWEKLLEVYTTKADIVVDPDEKKRLYAEVGAVYEGELKDSAKAIDSYQRILEIDPDDLTALGRLDALYLATENWQELMSVLEREADLVGEPSEVISFRYRIAELWHQRLDDATQAIDIYRDILEVAPDHEPTLNALEALIAAGKEPVAAATVLEPIYRQNADATRLIAVLEVQTAHEEDPLRKVELLHQVSELYELHLDDAVHAFAAQARALPFDNRDENTLGSLERLAEITNQWSEVTRLYDVELAAMKDSAPDDVVDMALRTAALFEQRLGDANSAIERYQLVVEADPSHVDAIEALDRLFAGSGRWAELADILLKEIDVAASPDDMLNLQYRLGQVREQHLSDVDGAISQYQEILAAAPEHGAALGALESLFAQGVKPLEIGEILEPLYRMQESWGRLLSIHEVQLNYQGDAGERVQMMHRIAEIAEERAIDHDRAFLWMQRAVLEDPSHEHSIAESERLCSVIGGWAQLANTYADGLQTAEGEHKLFLGKRLARIFEEELGDVGKAEEAYRFVLGVSDKDEDSLEALDRIYVQYQAPESLAAVLRKRIEATDLPGDLVDLNYRLGQVLENDLARTEEAIAVYDHVLGNLEPEHPESVAALQEIYTRQQNWPALQTAFQKELDGAFGDTQRAEITAKMARLASARLSDQSQAINLWKEVLDLRGEDHEALNALGDIYAAQENWAELVDILEREVSIVEDDGHRVQIYADLGRIWYERLERDRNALESWERVLDIDPSNTGALFHIAEIYRAGNQHMELVDTLHRVVEVGGAILEESQLENVQMQLGHLYNTELQQPVDAVDAYNQALLLNPNNFDAMNALEHIHRGEEMWVDAIGVMEKRYEALADPAEKTQQLLTIAQTWAEKADNADGGTSAYERILEANPADDFAFGQLEVLHSAAGRWEELIDMYVVRVEESEDIDQSVLLLGKVAKVNEEHLDDLEQAYDALSVAWSLDYGHRPTMEELERVTAATNKWNELLTVANESLREAEDDETKIQLCLCCARWYGQHLGHPEYAIPYYEQIRALDPTNVAAMRSMAELYETTQQWDALSQTLGQIVQLSNDADVQAETYVQMGALAAGPLSTPEQAGMYYRKALEVAPENITALEALEGIFRQEQNWAEVAEMLSRKAAASAEDGERLVDTKLSLAEVYETHTGDADKAIATYLEVRAADEFNMPALRGLERLYRAGERWQELLEVLQTQYGIVSTEKDRITLLSQMAVMWEDQFVKPEHAAAQLEAILEIDPMHGEALTSLARLYRQMQQWEKLIDTFERHVSATPDRAEKIRVFKAMGETYAKDLDDADRAVDSYLNVLSIEENDIEALDALTRIYDKRGDHASALEMMEQLVKQVQDPAHQVDLLYRMGRIFDQELGDRMSALEKYQTALDLEPGHVETLAAMRKIQLDDGDWLAAAKLLEQEAANQTSPRLVAERLVELGNLYQERLDEPEKAVEVFEAALKQDEDNEDAAMPLVDVYTRQERHDAAFPLLSMLVKRSGKREPHEQHRLAFSLGEAATKLGQHKDAIKAFAKAYEIDTGDLPTLIGLANAYFADAQWGEAFKYFQMLLVHHRDSLGGDETVDIFYRLGVVKREQGERRKALNMFDKALEEDGYHRPTLEAVVDLYASQNEWQQVIHFKKQMLDVIDDVDERFTLLDQVGSLWKDKVQNTAKAIEAWSEATDLKPDDHRMLHKLLGAYQETRQWEPAIAIIEQVADLETRAKVKSKYAYTIAVIIRDELKDPDGALAKFGQALDLDADNLKAFEAINKIFTTRKDWKGLERAYRKMIHRIIKEDGREDLKHSLFYTLGIIYRDRQQNFEAAAETFRTAAALRPEDPTQHKILAELYMRMPDKVNEAIEEHQWLLKQDANRVDSYRALYRLYFDARAYDKAWCVAAALDSFGKADNEQQQFYSSYKAQGAVRFQGRVDRNMWFNQLFDPEEDRYVSKLMELMAPAVLAVKASSDRALNLHRLKPVDVANNTATFVRSFHFVSQTLAIPTVPRLFLQQQTPGGLVHIPGSNPPSALAGSSLLSGYSPQDLLFVNGRFLSYYLSEHFIRTIFQSHTELRMVLLAALRIAGQGPANPQVDQWAQQLAPHLGAANQDALRQVARKFIEAGGAADIKKWMQRVEMTAMRAGFLMCNDLPTVRKMLQSLPPDSAVDLPPGDKLKEIVLFSVSEQYFQLRQALGIQIQV